MRADRFVITLKNEKTRRYISLGFVLAGINLIPFVLFLFYENAWPAGVTGLASTLVYFVIRYFIVRNQKGRYYIDENLFFILAAVWLMQSSLMAVLILATGILFKITLQPLNLIFTYASVQKDFFPKKEYRWDDLDSVILKDGILTINFKNDKLIQAPAENLNTEETNAFNEFVAKRLSQEK